MGVDDGAATSRPCFFTVTLELHSFRSGPSAHVLRMLLQWGFHTQSATMYGLKLPIMQVNPYPQSLAA